MNPAKVLVIAPAFHQYGDAIARAFTEIGYDATAFAYDGLPDIWAKVDNKLRVELPTRLGSDRGAQRRVRRVTDRALGVLRATRPDRVVVVRGDALDDRFWSELVALGAPTVVWLYDELERMTHDLDTLRSVAAVATYSPVDAVTLSAQGIRASALPLAFDTSLRYEPRPAREIVFVGAAYPGRIAALTALHSAEIPVRGFGRDWSHAPFDRLRTWKLHRPDLPWGREVDRAAGYGVMAGATATLNLHGVQDGFTMRTFEACGAGALQIIDRSDVTEHFDIDIELVAFDSTAEMIDLGRRAMEDRPWRDAIAAAGRRRALAEHTFVHRARALEAMWG